jgi:hypothetical protein
VGFQSSSVVFHNYAWIPLVRQAEFHSSAGVELGRWDRREVAMGRWFGHLLIELLREWMRGRRRRGRVRYRYSRR